MHKRLFVWVTDVKNKPAVERELTPEEVDEKAESILPPDMLTGLADPQWKNRMTAAEQFLQVTLSIYQLFCLKMTIH